MFINNLTHADTWLNTGERDAANEFLHAISAHLESHQIPPSPILDLRANDAIIALLFARRLEKRLFELLELPNSRVSAALVNAVSHARGNYRRALAELQSGLPAAETPKPLGLADIMKPIILKAGNVWEEVAAMEAAAMEAAAMEAAASQAKPPELTPAEPALLDTPQSHQSDPHPTPHPEPIDPSVSVHSPSAPAAARPPKSRPYNPPSHTRREKPPHPAAPRPIPIAANPKPPR